MRRLAEVLGLALLLTACHQVDTNSTAYQQGYDTGTSLFSTGDDSSQCADVFDSFVYAGKIADVGNNRTDYIAGCKKGASGN